MEMTRFWASLEMSQYVSDMTSSGVMVILMLGIQIMLVAGEGIPEAIVCHFWILTTEQQSSIYMHHISSRNSKNVVPQHFKQFCKT
jgi:hypothetical protein